MSISKTVLRKLDPNVTMKYRLLEKRTIIILVYQ